MMENIHRQPTLIMLSIACTEQTLQRLDSLYSVVLCYHFYAIIYLFCYLFTLLTNCVLLTNVALFSVQWSINETFKGLSCLMHLTSIDNLSFKFAAFV